jgi:hypothetical protein
VFEKEYPDLYNRVVKHRLEYIKKKKEKNIALGSASGNPPPPAEESSVSTATAEESEATAEESASIAEEETDISEEEELEHEVGEEFVPIEDLAEPANVVPEPQPEPHQEPEQIDSTKFQIFLHFISSLPGIIWNGMKKGSKGAKNIGIKIKDTISSVFSWLGRKFSALKQWSGTKYTQSIAKIDTKMTEFKAWWDSINWPSLSFRPMIDIVEGAKNKYKEIVDLIKGLAEQMENRVEMPIQINILSYCIEIRHDSLKESLHSSLVVVVVSTEVVVGIAVEVFA